MNAIQLVDELASEYSERNASFTFCKITSRNYGSSENLDLVERMSWRGLVDIYQSGDLEDLVPRLVKHSKVDENANCETVLCSDIASWLPKKIAQLNEDENIVVCSRVTGIEDKIFHIPMLDFRHPPEEKGEVFAIESLKKLGVTRGELLNSGRSYHFYGRELMTEDEWLTFMHKSLLLTPFVDCRFIGHRLLAGTGRLRITSNKAKRTVPFVVASF